MRPSSGFSRLRRTIRAAAVAAIVDVEQDEWFDPSFLQRVAPSALRITIVEGEKKVQDLRVH